MTRFYPAVVSAIDPCLQIGEDKMDHRQVFLCLLRIAPERENIVLIIYPAKVIISLPTISANNGAGRHIFGDESGKCLDIAARKRSNCLFHARDDAEPKAPSISKFLDRNATFMRIPPLRAASFGVLTHPYLDGTNYRCLMMGAFSLAARSAPYKAFVYLDGIRCADGISVWPNHTGAELVKHRERRLISSNVKLTLKLNGGLAWRLCCHEVSAPKPRRERHMARLHDRPGSERRIFFTGPAAQYNRRAGCEPVRLAGGPALRTREAVRPAHRLQVPGTSAVIREDALKLWKARWKGCIHV